MAGGPNPFVPSNPKMRVPPAAYHLRAWESPLWPFSPLPSLHSLLRNPDGDVSCNQGTASAVPQVARNELGLHPLLTKSAPKGPRRRVS